MNGGLFITVLPQKGEFGLGKWFDFPKAGLWKMKITRNTLSYKDCEA